MGISCGKQKSCSEVIYWFCFPARGLVLIYFAVSPEASSRLKCRHRMLGWTKCWQENAFGFFNWKNILLLSPRGQDSTTAAQGEQGNVYEREMLWFTPARGIWREHRGPYNCSQCWDPTGRRERFPGGWWGPAATPGRGVGCEPPAEQSCAEFRSCHSQAGCQFRFCCCELTSINFGGRAGSHSPTGMAQCWSPAADGRSLSQAEMLCDRSGRDPHVPTSDPTTLFSVRTVAITIQLEKVMGRELFIPKKRWTSPYTLKMLSSPCAAPVLLVPLSFAG